MRKPPPDSLSSVDRALRLIHLLRDQGGMSVTEAAAALGVSVSSAHRLLATLVYRDFAEQDERRRYLPGPALSLRPGSAQSLTALREALRPAMRRLAVGLAETISLGVLIDDRIRIIGAAEASRVLRVSDQEGTVLPAHRTAIGKVVLASLTDAQLAAVYGTDPGGSGPLAGAPWTRLRAELRAVRRTGFAVNHGDAEDGVSAIGVPVPDRAGRVQAGLAVAMPSSRFSAKEIAAQVAALTAGIARSRRALDELALVVTAPDTAQPA